MEDFMLVNAIQQDMFHEKGQFYQKSPFKRNNPIHHYGKVHNENKKKSFEKYLIESFQGIEICEDNPIVKKISDLINKI
jgi:hypothetical protein